jgi:hypothetical protein
MDAAVEIPLLEPEKPKKKGWALEYFLIGVQCTIFLCIIAGAIVVAVLLL